MSVKFKLESRTVPDGTVLLFGIRYAGAEPDNLHSWPRKPEEEAKVYTYAMIKAGGFWYVTGGGRTPQAAGWGAVERWLERDGRVVEWVRHVTETTQLWPRVDDLANAKAAEEAAQPAERRRGTEWRDKVRTPEDDALGYHDL